MRQLPIEERGTPLRVAAFRPRRDEQWLLDYPRRMGPGEGPWLAISHSLHVHLRGALCLQRKRRVAVAIMFAMGCCVRRSTRLPCAAGENVQKFEMRDREESETKKGMMRMKSEMTGK